MRERLQALARQESLQLEARPGPGGHLPCWDRSCPTWRHSLAAPPHR